MKKALVLVVLVAILVLALSGTALASGVQSAGNVVQAAMYSHTWGLEGTAFYVQQAIFQGSVQPTTPTPGGVLPPSPVFPQ
jgi:hypothetical protein